MNAYMRRRPRSAGSERVEDATWTRDIEYGGTLFADVDSSFRAVVQEDEDRRRHHWEDRSPPVIA
jgi:hypothetical protein